MSVHDIRDDRIVHAMNDQRRDAHVGEAVAVLVSPGSEGDHWQQTVRSPMSTRLPVGVEFVVVWHAAFAMVAVYLNDL